MLLAGFLEMIGIGLILPLLSLLTGTLNSSSEYSFYLNNFINSFELEKERLIIFFIIFICILYLVKNLYLSLIFYLQSIFVRDFQTKLGKKLLNAYLSMPFNYFSKKNSSIFIRNLSNDLPFLSNSLSCYAMLVLEGSIIALIIVMLSPIVKASS